MQAAKIPLKSANEVKQFIIKNSFHDNRFFADKDGSYIYMAIISPDVKDRIKEEFNFVEFVDRDLPCRDPPAGLQERLSCILTEEEMAQLKTAFDQVGDIAIIEIDDELKEKETLIAETLLDLHKNLKVVLKKGGIHGGTFRTQNMVHLAGEDRKETFHKENGVTLKLNVEDVYFSPRLSTERKRIMMEIAPMEDVLVMFSGCAPYPCVISKNTKARSVFGIELNPAGHMYGMENVRLNRLHNVILINGDVKEIVPNIFHHIVGLKSSDDEKQLDERLKEHLVIMELHLHEDDLSLGSERLEATIVGLQSKGIDVVLHMPFSHGGVRYTLAQRDVGPELAMLRTLGRLCKKYHIKAVVHPSQYIGIAEEEEVLVKNLKKISEYFDYFYFENTTKGIFGKADEIIRIGKKAGIKNMCIDICHLFITYQDNAKVEKHIKEVRLHFNTYFHLNDHDYKAHSCEIGKGFVDFSRVLPYVNLGVTEVTDKDEMHLIEMLRSYEALGRTVRKFDRILMPLPKSAEDFLDSALLAAKKGTIIHFYDFLAEDNFSDAHEKIRKACENNKMEYRILNTVKCGQHAPHVYRICVDFEII